MKIEKVAALTELRFNWRRPVCESTRPLPRRAETYGAKVTKRRGSEAVNMFESVNEREDLRTRAPWPRWYIWRGTKLTKTTNLVDDCCAQAAGYSLLKLLCHR